MYEWNQKCKQMARILFNKSVIKHKNSRIKKEWIKRKIDGSNPWRKWKLGGLWYRKRKLKRRREWRRLFYTKEASTKFYWSVLFYVFNIWIDAGTEKEGSLWILNFCSGPPPLTLFLNHNRNHVVNKPNRVLFLTNRV